MNIFHLDANLKLCAIYHCNLHVIKMIIEYAQLLSTAHRVLDGTLNGKILELEDKFLQDTIYRASHINHPCAVWVRECLGNYTYLYELFIYLSEEYSYRYKKNHATYLKLKHHLNSPPKNINPQSTINYSSIPLCVSERCKIEGDYIQSYRNFYIYEKAKKFKLLWKEREVPYWFLEV